MHLNHITLAKLTRALADKVADIGAGNIGPAVAHLDAVLHAVGIVGLARTPCTADVSEGAAIAPGPRIRSRGQAVSAAIPSGAEPADALDIAVETENKIVLISRQNRCQMSILADAVRLSIRPT